ncbi:MAG: hypothetical protein JW870_02400 [Candidatus Delongbacteria bacterium]|nr:hypothetical protein [Candidatus Delongbacteria bacterium]
MKKICIFFIFFSFIFLLLVHLCCKNQPINLENSTQTEICFKDFHLSFDFILTSNNNHHFKKASIFEIGKDKNLYICDKSQDKILIFTDKGEYFKSLGKETLGNFDFSIISDMAVDEDGHIYLSACDYEKKTGGVWEISEEETLNHLVELPFSPKKIFVKEQNIFIIPKAENIQNYSIYKLSKVNNDVSKIIEIFNIDSETKSIENEINFNSDQHGRFILSYRYKPKVKIITETGKNISEFDCDISIKNERPPVEVITEVINEQEIEEKSVATYRLSDITHPICYDAAVDESGQIFLLLATDHLKNETSLLSRYDSQGTLIEKINLPFSCVEFQIDDDNNFYFCSQKNNFVIKFNYLSRQVSEKENSALLKDILDKSSDYCERLKDLDFTFSCTADIEETIYHPFLLALRGEIQPHTREKNLYVYHYHLEKKDDNIDEKWLLIDGNEVKRNIEVPQPDLKRFYSIWPIYGPLEFLSSYQQKHYFYKIKDIKTIEDQSAYLIEALPKSQDSSDKDHVSIWISKENFRILKIVWNQFILDDPSATEEIIQTQGAEPRIELTVEYFTEVEGVRLPTKYSINEDYQKVMLKLKKSSTSIKFKNYNFSIKNLENSDVLIK